MCLNVPSYESFRQSNADSLLPARAALRLQYLYPALFGGRSHPFQNPHLITHRLPHARIIKNVCISGSLVRRTGFRMKGVVKGAVSLSPSVLLAFDGMRLGRASAGTTRRLSKMWEVAKGHE